MPRYQNCAVHLVLKRPTQRPYHPLGDGLVERANRALLNMLRAYVDREDQWR